jgi:NAD+ kinase
MTRVIGAVLKPGAPEALAALRQLHALAPEARLLVEREGHHAVSGVDDVRGVEAVDATTFAAQVELVVVLGGDGTLIHAASLLESRVVPILGVNLGHIGFLTEVARDEIARAFPLALRGELPFEDRMRLDVEVRRDGKQLLSSRILNDAVLSPRALARIATYRVSFKGETVTTIRGDGVIISTPTGSTAYALAAGGSILAPALRAVAITPICPHQLTQRPLIVDPSADLIVTLDSDSPVYCTLDGQAGSDFRQGDVMVIRPAPVPTRLVSVPWRSYFQMLRAKLRWGDGT